MIYLSPVNLTGDLTVSVVAVFLAGFSVGFIEPFMVSVASVVFSGFLLGFAESGVVFLIDVLFFVCTIGFSEAFVIFSVAAEVFDGYSVVLSEPLVIFA